LCDEVRSLLGWHSEATTRLPSSAASWIAQPLRRRAAPPSTATGAQTLPDDVLQLTCRRIRLVSLVFAATWAGVTAVNNLLAEQMNHALRFYPSPGNEVAVLAVLVSLAVAAFATSGAAHPKWVMHAGGASMVV